MPRSAPRWSLAFAAVVCMVGATTAGALDPSRRLTQYVQVHWRMEEGLPHNTVRTIRQSKEGYIWLGTYAGLARFDGVRFRVYDNLNSGLRDNEVRSLAEDKQGVLWVGTTSGGLHRLIGDRLEPFDHGIGNRTINALVVADDGALWVGSNEGLHRIFAGQVTSFLAPQGLDSPYVNELALDGQGIWIATTRGLYLQSGDRVSKVLLPSLDETDIGSVIKDREGRLWVGLTTHVLAGRFDPVSRRFNQHRDFRIPRTIGAVHRLLQDREGSIWAATYGGGLFRIHGDRMDRFTSDSGFIDHRPWGLLEDREGSLWVGTRAGLARLTDGPAVTFSQEEGTPADLTRAVREDPDGSVWIATAKGLAHYREGTIKSYGTREGLPSEVVRGVLRDHRGELWANTNDGIARFDEARDRFKDLIDERHGLPYASVRVLLEDRKGRVWATTERGVAYAKDGLASRVFETPPGLGDVKDATIESIFEDSEGGIWIGTFSSGFRRWVEGKVDGSPLIPGASVGVRSFHEDQDGTLYLGTLGSGLFVRRKGGAFRRITSRDGLREDSIWSILQDGDLLWMASDRGVLKTRRSSLLAFIDGRASSVVIDRVVGTRDGMKSRECNGGGGLAGFIGRDGRLWFPTGRGAVAIDPRKLDAEIATPPAAIEEAVIDRVPQGRTGELRVPPGSRDVEIHYTGLSFVDPARLAFRYRLEGYDAGWIDAGERRVAYYASLPPGDYRFRVEAAFGNGAWSSVPADRRVIVEPRLTQTAAFRGALLLSAFGLAGLTVSLRTRQLRRREEELKKLVALRTQELEKANAQLSELAAVDDLTGIANHRRLIQVLDQEWLRCQRGQEPLSLLLCDIDDFKAFNDTYGHQAGDACLRTVAQTLANTLHRTSDLAARYGGEEFAVVLPSTDEAGARAVAETIQVAIRNQGVLHSASRAAPHVTLSIGCATVRPAMGEPGGIEGLIASADRALYAAKNSGRDRIAAT